MNCKYCKSDCIFRGEQQTKECKGYIPMTNADRIRAMSDEELAGFLECEDWLCDAYNLCSECPMKGEGGKCLSVLEWLKQPADLSYDKTEE